MLDRSRRFFCPFSPDLKFRPGIRDHPQVGKTFLPAQDLEVEPGADGEVLEVTFRQRLLVHWRLKQRPAEVHPLPVILEPYLALKDPDACC